MGSTFFNSNTYFVDEKVSMFKFGNTYNLFDDKGENIGVVQQNVSTGQKFLRLLLNKKMLPFRLDILNKNGIAEATISRGWAILMSSITISDANGTPIATIRQKFAFFKTKFDILDNNGSLIAQITGDWKAWHFEIKDSSENVIGTINKKWAGAMKELFTTADKYFVSLEPQYAKKTNKIPILASAITIDMLLKEGS